MTQALAILLLCLSLHGGFSILCFVPHGHKVAAAYPAIIQTFQGRKEGRTISNQYSPLVCASFIRRSEGPQKLALSRKESQATTCCEEGRGRDLLGFPPQSWEANEGDDVVNGVSSGQASVSTTTSLVPDTGNTQCSLRSHLRWSVGE